MTHRDRITTYDGKILRVHIDVSRWAFVKHGDNGRIDFVSPLPCPFNYGHVPGTVAADGDADDAIVLGPRVAEGSLVEVLARARVDFVDGGVSDPKWICSDHALGDGDVRQVEAFFRLYAVIKRGANAARGRMGPTRFAGWM